MQILGAIEARDRFPANQHVIVLRKASQLRSEHNRQVEAILNLESWDEVIPWPAKDNGVRINRSYTHSRRFARSLKKRYRGKSVRLLMGGFNQFANHLLRSQIQPAQTITLDDGVATLHHFENYLSRNQYHPEWATAFDSKRGLRQRARALLSGINFDVLSEPIDLFTCFNLEPPKECQSRIFRHAFERLSEKSRDKAISEQQVFYFGSPLSEFKIVDFELETMFVGAVFDHYRSRRMAPVYIPHRNDSQAKLDFLSLGGQTVRRLGMPAEVYFATATELPSTIASSGSTALHNVAMISPSTQIEMLPIPEHCYLRKKEAAKIVMEHYQAMGIKIIQLDFAS